jgi:hypothetical protein
MLFKSQCQTPYVLQYLLKTQIILTKLQSQTHLDFFFFFNKCAKVKPQKKKKKKSKFKNDNTNKEGCQIIENNF